jgi:hypothetical protein
LKKLAAILLLAVYLFNLAGYSLVFHYFMQQSDQQFAQNIEDHRYADEQLVEIAIPFSLPYTQNNTTFERMEGSVELNGVIYNYVKRRVYNDTLHILCLPNQKGTQLAKEKSTYAGQVNDFAAQKSKDAPGKKMSPLSEYNNVISLYKLSAPAGLTGKQNQSLVFLLPQTKPGTPGHPPRFNC